MQLGLQQQDDLTFLPNMTTQQSWWETDQWFAPADVVVAGAGLMGLWTAYELLRQAPQLKLTLLEAGSLPCGASTRNAGFACFGSPTELWHDAQQMGPTAMLDVVDMRYRGIQKIRSVLGDALIGYEPCGGYECYTQWPPLFHEQLGQLNQWLQPLTRHPLTFSDATRQLPSLGLHGFAGMVKNDQEGSLHSGKLVQALTQLVQQMGATILFQTRLLHWHTTSSGIVAHTSRGALPAQKLVLATNAWLHTMAPSLGIQPARGQVMVSHPLPGLALHGTFHFQEGFYYWRHIGNRVLLGGARHLDMAAENTLVMETSPTIQQALEHFLITHLPQHFTPQNITHTIAYRWSGLMAMSPSKQPVLQALQPGIWAAMCCNGMGVAITPVFAEKIAAALLTT
jgi:gamma-glutamylputrescine oxidase